MPIVKFETDKIVKLLEYLNHSININCHCQQYYSTFIFYLHNFYKDTFTSGMTMNLSTGGKKNL